MSKCGVCNQKTKISDSVTCDICRKPVHTDCANLSKIEVECIKANSRAVHFYCPKCDIVAIINNLKTEIDDLKSQINELKSAKSCDVVSDPSKNLSIEDVFTEIEERNRRANNLIIYNVPESEKSSADQRKQEDIELCKEIVLNDNSNTSNARIVNCIRLGKFSDSKLRPVKIVLETADQAQSILRTYRRKENFYLHKDLTVRQQHASYLTRTEYKTRQQQGENDIVLKYVNGLPKIIKKPTLKN